MFATPLKLGGRYMDLGDVYELKGHEAGSLPFDVANKHREKECS